MITVQWPSSTANYANVWRCLDLSGLTKSVRQSKNCVHSGVAYLNNTRITLQDTVELGTPFNLEVRWPMGRITSKDITLTNRYYASNIKMPTTPLTRYYK